LRTGKENKINTREKLQEEKQKNDSLNQLQEMAIFWKQTKDGGGTAEKPVATKKKKKLRSQKVKCETQKKIN
jgi:hypothetical protein